MKVRAASTWSVVGYATPPEVAGAELAVGQPVWSKIDVVVAPLQPKLASVMPLAAVTCTVPALPVLPRGASV